MRNTAVVESNHSALPSHYDEIVCLTEYAGELLGERDRRRRWRRIVENWHVDQAAALREADAARLAIEKERARTAKRDRSAYLQQCKAERAAKKARLAGRPMTKGERHV